MVATKPISAAAFFTMRNDVRVELIDGAIVEMSPTSFEHVFIHARLNRALTAYSLDHPEIAIFGGEGGYLLQRNPDSVIAPDLAIVHTSQYNDETRHRPGAIELVPMVAVEVKSPSDRESYIARKLSIYLDAGVREVWWVRPEKRQITVHREDEDPLLLTEDDLLQSPAVLPGFALHVAELFAPISG